MTDGSSIARFSVPYEIAVVRPLRQTTTAERSAALKAAYYNTELLPQEMIYIDLKTDSGVSSISTAQLSSWISSGALEAGMEMAAEGNQAFSRLAETFRRIFGFSHMVPVSQGRAAERIWSKIHVKPDSFVPGNMLFPSTRMHIESNGAKVVDVISDAAHDLSSDEPFKGNVDLNKLEAVFKQSQKVSCVYVELCVNSCGGHPVSLANLTGVKEIAAAHHVPLFLDACRILENSYLINRREPAYRNHSIAAIVREICSLAEGLTMSALKDFLVPVGGILAMRDEPTYQKAYVQSFFDGSQPPSSAMDALRIGLEEVFSGDAYVRSRADQVSYLWHRLQGRIPVLSPAGGHGIFIDAKSFLPRLADEDHPAEALAAFAYQSSGIRLTKGPPLAPSQLQRGTQLLRLAVPPRRYLQAHMDDVAEAILYAYARRDEIGRLRRIEQPGRSKYDPPLFERV